MRTDPAFRARVEELGPIVSALAELPAEAWTVGLERPVEARRPAPTVAQRRKRPLRFRVALAAAGMAVALVAGLAGYLIGHGSPSPTPAFTQVASAPLHSVGNPGTRAHGTVAMSSDGRMVLVARHLDPSARGHYYELWLMSGPGRVVPVTSFRAGGRGDARVTAVLPVDASSYRFLDVSLQRAEAGAAHSKISVLRGAVPR
jgi:hypothetical protein